MSTHKQGHFAFVTALLLVYGSAACSGASHEEGGEASHPESAGEHAAAQAAPEAGERREGGEHEERGEHDGAGEHREGGEHEGGEGEGGEGEEGGVYIEGGATWDAVRRGARLILAFDPATDAFTGTVENTTGSTLCAVRVEVHLSGGIELGPTERIDLEAGQSTDVALPTGGHAFETWTAHPEVGSCAGG